MHYTLVRDSSKFSIHMAFLRNLTTGWPNWPLQDLWPHQCITLSCGVHSTKFSRHRTFLRNLTSGWPQLTSAWPPIPAMSYTLKDQGFFLIKFGGHTVFLSNLTIWPLVDPGWSMHDLWPKQCITVITLCSGVLPTKFGGHGALLSKLTPTWPQLIPTWPLTPAMYYALVSGSSHQVWWP